MSRWVAISSTAYEDRDRQIVSTKALANDCDRADRDRQYGPLLWWHEPGWVLGYCDFNAMHGRMLIESGTFRNEALARAAQKAARRFEVSIRFDSYQPAYSGVFDHIRRVERSLVPRGKASNRFTQFLVMDIARPVHKATAPTLKDFIDMAFGPDRK